jgi:phosphate transport system substrate-binding protein
VRRSASNFKARFTALVAVVVALSLLLVPSASAATVIRTGGGSVFQLIVSALAIDYKKVKHDVTITVVGGGSGAGIVGAARGTLDIGNSSRDQLPSDPPGLKFTAVGREGYAIVVNPKNPIRNLTHAQIKAILTGQTTSWSAVGWPAGGPIQVYSRIPTSGSYVNCKRFFTDSQEFAANAPQTASHGITRVDIGRDKRGIACIALSYLTTARGTIKGVAIDGIAPTLRNAIGGRYHYLNNLYFVTNGEPSGPVADYIQWVLTRRTQCTVMALYVLPLPRC